MNYQIMPITEKHIESFCAAVDSVSRERKYLNYLEGPPLTMSRAFVQKNLAENWPHYIAIDGNRVIGWCDITGLDKPVLRHTGVLGIGVIATYRGQGIGNALIQAALKHAKSIGMTRIELTVREHNQAAIELYKKFGFEIEGLQRKAIKIDDKYENHVCMALLW